VVPEVCEAVQEPRGPTSAATEQLLKEVRECRQAAVSWRSLHQAATVTLKKCREEISQLRQELRVYRSYSPGIKVDLWCPALTADDRMKRVVFYKFIEDLYLSSTTSSLREMHDRVQALPMDMAAMYDAYRRQYFLKSLKLQCASDKRVQELEALLNERYRNEGQVSNT
jgi:hypothetical protein